MWARSTLLLFSMNIINTVLGRPSSYSNKACYVVEGSTAMGQKTTFKSAGSDSNSGSSGQCQLILEAGSDLNTGSYTKGKEYSITVKSNTKKQSIMIGASRGSFSGDGSNNRNGNGRYTGFSTNSMSVKYTAPDSPGDIVIGASCGSGSNMNTFATQTISAPFEVCSASQMSGSNVAEFCGGESTIKEGDECNIECKAGYEYTGDVIKCKSGGGDMTAKTVKCNEINACLKNACPGENVECKDKVGGPATADGRICVCDAGYAFGDGTICEDINACATAPCTGKNEVCVDLEPPKPDGATGRRCDCKDGYALQGGVCEDVDNCETHKCPANAKCTNLIGIPGEQGRKCVCNDGFIMSADGTTCSDIDGCSVGAGCVNYDGNGIGTKDASRCKDIAAADAAGTKGFTCAACSLGYTAKGAADSGECVDIDGCSPGVNDPCEGECTDQAAPSTGRTCGALQCSPTTYCTAGSGQCSDASTCTVCGDGTMPNADRSACSLCPQGSAGTGGECAVCALGTTPNDKQDSCINCPAGTAQFSAGGDCTPCPLGTYALSGASICNAGETCGPGKEPASDRTACVECTGAFVSTAGACSTKCDVGEQPNSARSDCEKCPAGRPSSGEQCAICPAGSQPNTDHSSCEACPAGSFRSTSDTSGFCVACRKELGMWASASKDECNQCGDGMEVNGAENGCTACAPGTAGTGGRCRQCNSDEAPNSFRDKCELKSLLTPSRPTPPPPGSKPCMATTGASSAASGNDGLGNSAWGVWAAVLVAVFLCTEYAISRSRTTQSKEVFEAAFDSNESGSTKDDGYLEIPGKTPSNPAATKQKAKTNAGKGSHKNEAFGFGDEPVKDKKPRKKKKAGGEKSGKS